MNQYDLKKLPLEIVTKAKKIIVETSKDLYNNVVDYVAADVQNNISEQKYKELPVKSVITITGDAHSIKSFEDLEESVGKGNAIDFFPITKSLEAWKKMNEKTPIGSLVREKVDQFNGSKEVYIQVGTLTNSEKLERAKKAVDYDSRSLRPAVSDFVPVSIPTRENKIEDDRMFDSIKETIKKRLSTALSKFI